MNDDAKRLYLDLMKKTLSFFLWPEPPVPIDSHPGLRSPLLRFLASIISKGLNKANLQLVRKRYISKSERREGRGRPWYADTMIGLERLDNLHNSIETILKEGIEGDLIETGVWRGGASIFMRAVLAAHRIKNRKVFVADSFEGLPKPNEREYPVDKDNKWNEFYYFAVSKEDVENNFRKYNLLDDQVVFLKGWFKDTLPNAPIDKLALLRLDGDMYGSTMQALEYLYPKLSNGGFCIIDDYHLDECKLAVDDYRRKHQINSAMKEIDWTGRYWRKG